MKTEMNSPWGWELPALTEEQADYLDRWFTDRKMSALAAAPMICRQKCLYRGSCPLALMNAPLPIGKECPIERTLIREWSQAKKDAIGVADTDKWSLGQIEYASLWELLLYRAAIEAKDSPIVLDSYRGVDNQGNALYEKKVNPAVAFIERIHKVLQGIGEDLIATRKAKAKLQQADDDMGPDEVRRKIEARIRASAQITAGKNKELESRIVGALPRPVVDIKSPPEPPDAGSNSS